MEWLRADRKAFGSFGERGSKSRESNKEGARCGGTFERQRPGRADMQKPDRSPIETNRGKMACPKSQQHGHHLRCALRKSMETVLELCQIARIKFYYTPTLIFHSAFCTLRRFLWYNAKNFLKLHSLDVPCQLHFPPRPVNCQNAHRSFTQKTVRMTRFCVRKCHPFILRSRRMSSA